MTSLTNSINYLTLYDKKEMEEILKLENEQRKKENLPLFTMDELQKREIIISKTNEGINGYSITNLTLNSNNDVSVLIERLYEVNKDDKVLNNDLFEAAIFVAVEKVQLMKNNNNEIPKIISSSVIINGQKIEFNITDEYIKRRLDTKFNKDAVKQKVEQDEKYKKERQEVENKINANTFYNDTGHRFHSNVDDKTKELTVVENDFDILSLDERLQIIQKENIGNNINLNEAYQKFEKEKITAKLQGVDELSNMDMAALKEESKDVITAASIIDNKENFQVDIENNVVFDKDNKRIDVSKKIYESQNLADEITSLISIGYSKLAIDRMLGKKHPEWKSLSVEDKERIFDLYGISTHDYAMKGRKDRDVDLNSNELSSNAKKLVLKNDQAYVSYVVISFISGLASGLFITLLITFLNSRWWNESAYNRGK